MAHIVSGVVLAGVGVGVFWQYATRIPFYDRLLWGIFLLPTALAALFTIGQWVGFLALRTVAQSLTTLVNTLGMCCLVVGTWTLLHRQSTNRSAFLMTIFVGLPLFFWVSLPDFMPFASVVQAMGILVLMLLGTMGLLRQNRCAIWIVGAALLLGVATKASAVSVLHPVDFYQYMVALALVLFGKAIDTGQSA